MQTIDLMKGWKLELQGEGDFQIVNRGPSGERQFFRIVPGPYSPVIEEEPDIAEPLGVGDYVTWAGDHTAPEGKIKGVICKDSPGGKILYRGNLTNFRGKDSGVFENGGHGVVVGGRRYRLYLLMAENKPRIKNYVALYLPEDTHSGGPVKIAESFELA